MFDGDDVIVGGQQRSNDCSSLQSLLHVQVTRRLIKHVPVKF